MSDHDRQPTPIASILVPSLFHQHFIIATVGVLLFGALGVKLGGLLPHPEWQSVGGFLFLSAAGALSLVKTRLELTTTHLSVRWMGLDRHFPLRDIVEVRRVGSLRFESIELEIISRERVLVHVLGKWHGWSNSEKNIEAFLRRLEDQREIVRRENPRDDEV